MLLVLMKNRTTTSLGLALILIASIGSTSILFATTQYTNAQESSEEKTVVRDSQTILLEGKTLPAKDFIHLYDTTPYQIIVGHVAIKLPCDSNSETPYKVLIGQAPNLVPAEFETVKELSKPGEMCLYHVDVKSAHEGDNLVITDIALQNPTDQEVKFGPTASIVIGIDEIMPGAEGHHEGGEAGSMSNMTMDNEA